MSVQEAIASANKEAAQARSNAGKKNSAFAAATKNTDSKAAARNEAIADAEDTKEEAILAQKAAKEQNELRAAQNTLAAAKAKENPSPEEQAEIAALEEKVAKEEDEFEDARDDYVFSLDDDGVLDNEDDAYNKDFNEIAKLKNDESGFDSEDVQDANEELDEAKANESRVLDEQAALFPESFGSIAKDLKDKYKKIKSLEDIFEKNKNNPPIPKPVEFDRNAEAVEYARLEAEILARKEAEKLVEPNEAISDIIKSQIESKMDPASHNQSYVHWDSPATAGATGKLEDIITAHLQPKMKFAYMGEFPGKLQPLDWMVKSMDKPKVDIESVEQIRHNVKRNYPVKYNYGDLSITFWDDMDHKTIMALYEYFSGSIWNHVAVPLTGRIMLRDSIVIPKFHIYELTSNSDKHLKYVFENAILSSFDFDNSEDESDDGVHTIQAVFKIERFETIVNKSPRTLNGSNAPVWM